MGKQYSIDLRKRVIEAVESGMSQSKAASAFSVSRSTIQNWLNLKHQTGSLEARPSNYPNRLKIDEKAGSLIVKLVSGRPDIRLFERQDLLEQKLQLNVDDSTISRFLRRVGYTRKKNGMLQRSR